MDGPNSPETAELLPHLLIVDDDQLITESLSFILSDQFAVTVASSRQSAISCLNEYQGFDVALIDLGLPPNPHSPTEGLSLISEILALSPQTRIVVLSGQHDENNARLARTLGATDFVAKPVAPEILRGLLTRIVELHDSPVGEGVLLGRSPPMIRLRLQLRQFADSHFPVLVEGESGTGKELAARAIHRFSKRADKPFLALNCAAMAPTLVEAALFGHGKGAYTGAHAPATGYFEDADHGTLFLDEIGEMPLELQPKLLRVLENGEFQRVGETQTRRSSARVVAATNRDLREEVRAGRFRSDLYHRLSVFTIKMPTLRELGSDARLLLESFCSDYAQQSTLPLPILTQTAWNRIDAYPFPGNVRELRNVAIRLTAKYAGREIGSHELDAELDSCIFPSSIGRDTQPENIRDSDLHREAVARLGRDKEFNLDATLSALESSYINAALEISNGNMSQAARLLGLSRTTLYNRIESQARSPRAR